MYWFEVNSLRWWSNKIFEIFFHTKIVCSSFFAGRDPFCEALRTHESKQPIWNHIVNNDDIFYPLISIYFALYLAVNIAHFGRITKTNLRYYAHITTYRAALQTRAVWFHIVHNSENNYSTSCAFAKALYFKDFTNEI